MNFYQPLHSAKRGLLFLSMLAFALRAVNAQSSGADFTVTTTGMPVNTAIHSGNLEAAHYDKKNFFIDWYSQPYYERCRQMAFNLYSWPGSSVSHSLYFIPGDTIAKGPGRTGNGFNGKYLNWGEAPCSPTQKQGYLVNHAVLDGVNCIDWQISFAPYAVNWCKELNAKMITVINANDYDWQGNKFFLSWIQKKKIYPGIVVAGLELGGNNYSNKTDFPNGGIDYVNNVLTPLCDSMQRFFPGSIVVADVNPPQRGSKNSWNRAVAESKAQAVRAYILSADLSYISEGGSARAYIDSVNRAITEYLPERLDLFQKTFPGKKLYIHQWQCTWQPIRGTVLDMLYCALYTNEITRYDRRHPGYIIANCFNGNGRINLEKKAPRISFYALVQQGKMFRPGATYSDVKTSYPGLDCIAVSDANGNHLRIVNMSPNSIPIRSITVNGKAVTAYRGTSYFAASADSRAVTEMNISREIPPFSDTVIDF
jgi:hypothetical protein